MSKNVKKGESPFVTPAAVEAWDAWFRWRENGILHDDTVEATWQRVASALASVEPEDERAVFEQRLLDACVNWRLLLDERVLATAGTGAMSWTDEGLVAVLNVAGFVHSPASPQASIDFAEIEDCAELAVHALDNAIVLRNGPGRIAAQLRIGLVGLANALALLGLEYDSAQARTLVQRIAQALAEGCLRATVALAETRGSAICCDEPWLQRARLRGTPPDLIDRAVRHGLRHIGLTAITSQPRLARFANDVADAVHPLTADPVFSGGRGSLRSKALAPASVPAQLDLRGAMQPWIDEPISCPVQSSCKPAPARHLEWYARVAALRLGALSWRLVPRG